MESYLIFPSFCIFSNTQEKKSPDSSVFLLVFLTLNEIFNQSSCIYPQHFHTMKCLLWILNVSKADAEWLLISGGAGQAGQTKLFVKGPASPASAVTEAT